TPPTVAVAKGLGGGFPVGACLATEAAAPGMVPGVHGTTFGGNPLAMAVGNAVVEEIGKPEFLEDVRAKSRRMKQKLAGLVDTH
ncbi:aminotransferase class III-fold pyridoxal phosphate-dependent enzyme, partial [Mycobacterium tuberculosis]|nr:aminotransferase class III-fold pyridoxal phosphate-dependent enzyme [Mycobacterium tuberculosis]